MSSNETWMEKTNRLVRGTAMYGAMKTDNPINPDQDIDILLVSHDKKQKVMLVGRKTEIDRHVRIVNVFTGEDAAVLYRTIINKQPRDVESCMVSMDKVNKSMIVGRQNKSNAMAVVIINRFAADAAQVMYDKLTKEQPKQEEK